MNDVRLPADCNERSSQHEFRRLYLIPPMRMEGQRQKSSMLIDLRCRMVFPEPLWAWTRLPRPAFHLYKGAWILF